MSVCLRVCSPVALVVITLANMSSFFNKNAPQVLPLVDKSKRHYVLESLFLQWQVFTTNFLRIIGQDGVAASHNVLADPEYFQHNPDVTFAEGTRSVEQLLDM